MREFFRDLVGHLGTAFKYTGLAIIVFALVFLPIAAAIVGSTAWALLLFITGPFSIALVLTVAEYI
jgi:hypothetical protein